VLLSNRHLSLKSILMCYHITWNFYDTFILRFWGVHISRQLNSTILWKFCILNHFNFAFSNDGTQSSFPWQCSLNLVNWLYWRYNNIKTNKNTTAGLYMYINHSQCESLNFRIMWCSWHLLFASLKFRDFFKSWNSQD